MIEKMAAPARLTRRAALRASAAAGAAMLLSIPASREARAAEDQGPIEPRAGTWKPWLLTSGSQFRLPAPPDRATTEAEIRELKAMAGTRDAASLDRIAYWDAGAAPYRWNDIYFQYSIVASAFDDSTGRGLALMNAALYDAMIAVWDSKYAHNRPRPTEFDPSLTAAVPIPYSPSYPSEHAAAAGAASAVLAHLYPQLATTFLDMGEEAAQSRVLAGAGYPSDVAAGLELGRRVADLAIERARTDNSDYVWDGVVPEGPGLWRGTNPIGINQAVWRPWVMSSPDQLRPGPPPAYDSDQLAVDLAELKEFPRTPRTNGLALGFQYGTYGTPGLGVVPILQASQRIFEGRLDANAPWAARAYAMLAVAYADTFISNQDAKFAYWQIRPNQLDPTLTTVFPTPNHPSYLSNRAAFAAASSTVLGHLFPREAEDFTARADDIAESAIWAGIHFRSDIEASKENGRQIAAMLLDRIKNDA